MAKAKSSTHKIPEEELSKEAVADEDFAEAKGSSNIIMTVGDSNIPGHNIEQHVVSISSSITHNNHHYKKTVLVKVLIKYPEDWSKDKFFKDGDVKEVALETAKTFIEIGIATAVTE